MNIIVGYDGKKAAKEALKLAKIHAKAFDGKVYVVTSLVGGTEHQEDQLKDIKKAEKDLEYTKEILEEDGIDCETHLLVRGLEPGEDIINFANQNNADEILIGVEKKSKVGKFIFGSTAQYIILEAKCPVIAVK
jgi:nucleotide-binding universal stress UspA family protein